MISGQSATRVASQRSAIDRHDWHGSRGRVARPNRQAQRRNEILDATIALIERHDLATLRLTDVATELGLTPNAVRYYFKDMDQLLSELALRSDVRFYDDRLAALERTRDVREQLAIDHRRRIADRAGGRRVAGHLAGRAGRRFRTRPAPRRAGDLSPAGEAVYAASSTPERQGRDVRACERTGPRCGDDADVDGGLPRIPHRGARPRTERKTALRLMRQYAELATGATLPKTT